jgi:hypothetical protein
VPPSPAQEREKLAERLAEIAATETRLGELDQAISRAAREFDDAQWALGRTAEACDAEQQSQPPTAAMIEAYIAGESAVEEAASVTISAQAAFNQARAEHHRLEALLRALEDERRGQELNLRLLTSMRDDYAAKLAYGGPAIEGLFAELNECWGRIRGLRMTFLEMHRRVPMSQAQMDRWQLVPNTLDWERDVSQAYSLSPLAAAWLPALENLLRDATTPLPGEAPADPPPPTTAAGTGA